VYIRRVLLALPRYRKTWHRSVLFLFIVRAVDRASVESTCQVPVHDYVLFRLKSHSLTFCDLVNDQRTCTACRLSAATKSHRRFRSDLEGKTPIINNHIYSSKIR